MFDDPAKRLESGRSRFGREQQTTVKTVQDSDDVEADVGQVAAAEDRIPLRQQKFHFRKFYSKK